MWNQSNSRRARVVVMVGTNSQNLASNGSVAQSVSALPCHGRGRRFKSGQSRKFALLASGSADQSAFGRGTPHHVAGSTPAFLVNRELVEYMMSARRAGANRGVYSLGDCLRYLNVLPRSVTRQHEEFWSPLSRFESWRGNEA